MLNLPLYNLPRLKTAIHEYNSYIAKKIEEGKAALGTDREKLEDRRGDLFSTLIRMSEGEASSELRLSNEEIAGNIYILMLAGHETSAHTLSFALGLLALNPNIQEDFLKEIKIVCGPDRKVLQYEDLINLKLGLAIMNETLRLYSIVTGLPKWAPVATHLGEGDRRIEIPANTYLNIHPNGLHFNPKYWGPDPETFRPNRFLGEYNKVCNVVCGQ
jgi:cytochrome P450